LWDVKDERKLDKDRFRRDLGGLVEAYQEVARRLGIMSTGEKIFKAGIAVAPVTDWNLYNTAYTERFMNRPQENFDGYTQTSAIGMVSKLNGKLLIVHGTADDNVHVQNTMLYIDKLVEADKQFEMQLYTDKNHSILGNQTRKHLYTRMSEFLFQNL
jgi:dipeptidyl-peptidase-4